MWRPHSCLLVLVVELVLVPMARAAPSSAKGQENELGVEEYVIEHDISEEDARKSALATDFNSVSTPLGCQKCTKEEMRYCLGSDLVNDHCCCDKRYHEFLPFIPHTCYVGTVICKPSPKVEDCEQYSRLMSCCCKKQVIKKWRKKFGASDATATTHSVIFILLFVNTNVLFL